MYTPLDIAAENGHDDIVRVFVAASKLGVAVDFNLDNGVHSAILGACMAGHPEVLEALIEGGADVNSRVGGVTPLTMAIIQSPEIHDADPAYRQAATLKVVTMLIDAGADVDLPDVDGETPLMVATHIGRPQAMTRLLEAGADPLRNGIHSGCASCDPSGITPRDMALAHGHETSAAVLQRWLDWWSPGRHASMPGCIRGQVRTVILAANRLRAWQREGGNAASTETTLGSTPMEMWLLVLQHLRPSDFARRRVAEPGAWWGENIDSEAESID